MGRRKTVKRKVVGYQISSAKTKKGNPRDYFFYLDCGHIRWEPHSPKSSITAFMVEMKKQGKFDKDIDMGCFDCGRGREVDFEKDWVILRYIPLYACKNWEKANPEIYKKFNDFCLNMIKKGGE